MPTKAIEVRIQEIQSIYYQLNELGLSKEHEGVAQFQKIANEYVKNGTSASGKIPLHGLKRHIVYKLSMQPHILSTVTLRFDKDL